MTANARDARDDGAHTARRDRLADGRSNRIRQRRCSVCVRRSGRIGDASRCRQQQGWRHQRSHAVCDARACAMCGAVAAVFVIRRGCMLKGVAMIHAAGRAGCFHAHVFVAGRVGSRRFNRRRGSSDGVVRTSRMRRRHRATHAVRHQSEAEQGMQQERAKAHRRSVLPTFPTRSTPLPRYLPSPRTAGRRACPGLDPGWREAPDEGCAHGAQIATAAAVGLCRGGSQDQTSAAASIA